MFKFAKIKKSHLLQLTVIVILAGFCMFMLYNAHTAADPVPPVVNELSAGGIIENTGALPTEPLIDAYNTNEQEYSYLDDDRQSIIIIEDEYIEPRLEAPNSAPPAHSNCSKDFRWVWNELPETVTRENNYYGGARRWELSDDLALHMCWCYGIRVTHHNPEIRYNGENFEGHYFWSREDSNDLVLTDKLNYIAVFDYERRITSTFAREGTRSYRFHNWSAYFFSDGNFNVVDAEGQIIVMEEGVFKIDPIEEWRFEVVPEFLIDLDQRFMMSLLIHNLPWEH